MKHHLSKYSSDGKRYATSWMQVNVFGKSFCFNVKTIEI